MLTKEQVQQENIVTQIVSKVPKVRKILLIALNCSLVQPPLNSVLLEDVLNYIHTEVVILKIDVESFECKVQRYNCLRSKTCKP